VVVCAWLLATGLGAAWAVSDTSQQVVLPAVDASDIRFTRVTFADAPALNRVHRILQDNQGFLWLAMQDKLQRYDGYEVRTYPTGPTNPDLPTSFYTLDDGGPRRPAVAGPGPGGRDRGNSVRFVRRI
jgi:hypothetical protein